MLLRRTTPVLVLLAFAACDVSEPPVATRFDAGTAVVLAGVAGGAVSVPPSVILADQRGRGLANVLVTWQEGVNSGLAGLDTVRTDSRGVASVGSWTLGIGVGEQSLTASVNGLEPVRFRAIVSPGAPAVMRRRSAEVQSAVVDTRVPDPPVVQVLDQFGNPVPGFSVTFAVVQGGGIAIGNAPSLTNGSGEARLEAWQLGTRTAVEHRLSATVPSVPAGVVFRATARADAAVVIEPASALQQDGVPALAVASRPAVRTRDRFGNPAGGIPVSFIPRTGSGTVSGSVRTTDDVDGIARVGGWVLSDTSPQELVARSSAFPADSFVFRVNAVPSLFFVETVFVTGEPSPRNLRAVERAAQRWRRVIAGQLPPVLVIASADACGPGVPAINEEITNVRVYIRFDSIDGPGSILGRAGPCFIRTATGLPVVGFVELDTADLSTLERTGTLDDVMTHEIGHVLGLQSFNWARRGLVVNQGGLDPHFQGAVGREGFAAIGGGSYTGIPVPLENTGGQGTRDSHWRLNVLRRELMVGFTQPGGMPLSKLSVGALADLGYQVRLAEAETFTMPPFGTAAFGALMMPATAVAYGDDHWPTAVWSVDATGRQQLVRAGDWRVTRRPVSRPGGR